ncbi:MAG: Rrf2 family transcriptional regulator [Planctomycetales bacterium]|nr:Rrf2 family transcriptional regulator [Planctomycetales bacterium]
MVILTRSAEKPITVQAMAERGQIPSAYLSKLLQTLTRAGLVTSQRGIGGGYTLTRTAEQIVLADIVNAVEPLKRITTCPLGIAGHATLCPLHRRLDQALANVEAILRETTLADLYDENGAVPLCDLTQLVNLTLTKE